MATERRPGDWDCEVCGAVVFASRSTCFKCERNESGTNDTPCGDFKRGLCNRENCRFSHDGIGGDAADVPECGDFKRGLCNRENCRFWHDGVVSGKAADVQVCGDFTRGTCTRDNCRFLHQSASQKKRKRKKNAAADKTKFEDEDFARGTDAPAAAAVTPAAAIKSLSKMSPTFKKGWVSYCKAYGEGYSDPSKYDEEFIKGFVEYGGGLIQADVSKADDDGMEAQEPQVATPAKATIAQPPKRPAEAAPAAAPPEKKKLSIKKSIADGIRRLNETGLLQVQIRLGAVAGNLSKFDEEVALLALSELELQQEEVEDPNVFLSSYVPE